MFRGCTKLTSFSATDAPDLSNVTDMSFAFSNATSFNQNISSWNTAAVTTMNSLFNGATSFDQDLSGWNVAAVTNYTNYDTGATAWQAIHKPAF
jgi:surface protein